MQVFFEISNTKTKIIGPSEAIKLASDALSYTLPGASHIQRNIGYNWDGRIKLLKRDGTFPTGLIRDAAKALMSDFEIQIVDKRVRPVKQHEFDFKLPFEPRYYQTEAMAMVRSHARGVYVMGTGSGKSAVIGLITNELGVDTLIITPDLGLKEQLFNDMANWFKGRVSKDIKSSKPIIITNIDSLTSKDPKYFERFNLLITDEFHHSAAKSYLKVNDAAKSAYYRYGLTGTLARTDGTEMNMYGVLSNVIYKKTTSDLIDEKFLVPAKIFIHQLKISGHSKKRWSEAYPAIALSEEFNRIVVYLAEKEIDQGKQTLILVRLRAHGELLKMRLKDKAVYLNGDDDVKYRDEQKALFVARKIKCLIATNILGEGQNIPNIDVLINARLQKSEIQTFQGIGRALRKIDGKDEAIVHDFSIQGNRAIYDHSLERIMDYRSERAFQIIMS